MQRSGTALIIAGLHPQPKKAICHAELDKQIGAENICPDMQSSIERAEAILRERERARLEAENNKED